MDFPATTPTPPMVHSYSRWAAGYAANNIDVVTFNTAVTWPVGNQATYVPFYLPWPYPVRRVFWFNGSSVASVNVDLGIFSSDGTQLYSTGSTARSGASVAQYVTPANPILLPPGAYYFGHSCDSTTASRGGMGATAGTTVAHLALAGILQQASALPLPATMTPVTVANVNLPLVGITRTATWF